MEPDMVVHGNDYNIIKNRMQNGTPFVKKRALERISALANDFVITQSEAEELNSIAIQFGQEVLPDDAMGRLDVVEQTTNELTLMMADLIGGAMV